MEPTSNTKIPESGTTRCGANRLSDALSPYLLQHANNPVAWQPWDDAALAQARRDDKPIFLSIGYAACHWCHVMEHESFENESIAALMNSNFVNIKVDREERPDLDDIYMKAVVGMRGQGGWPMSVFLTPDLKPFYGGTYFPPDSRYGMPGFRDVLEQIASFWQGDRTRLLENADKIADYLQQDVVFPSSEGETPGAAMLDAAVQALEDAYDAKWGGWGGAPKFPSPPSIALLLRAHHRNGVAGNLSMATTTLDRMRQGGIYDQLGGGFHRYSVDEVWRVPHFEKMLYDNAQLATAYLEAWQVTGKDDYRRIVCETLDYLIHDMQDASGGFYASQDADSEGGEGAYYLWTYDEIMEHLGEAGKFFCECHGVELHGNFVSNEDSHEGRNVLLLRKDAPDLLPLRNTLLQVRRKRVPPLTDDKVIASWNGLAVTAFAKAALALDAPHYRDAALRAGAFLRDNMLRDGGLLRCWRQGEARLPGYLDDYASVANAFIDLYECTADFAWLNLACALAEGMIEQFHNSQGGGFYATGAEHKHLLARLQSMHDTQEPCGNALATLALLRLGVMFGNERYTRLAEDTLAVAAQRMRHAPAAFLNLLLVADFQMYGATEITLAGQQSHPTWSSFRQVIGAHFIPNRVIIYLGESEKRQGMPAARGRSNAVDAPEAWVCRNRVCSPVAATCEELAKRLS